MYLGFPRFGKRRDVLRQENVLRFQIRVDDLALCVQEVQAVADLQNRKSSDSTTRHQTVRTRVHTDRVIFRTISTGIPLYLNALMSVRRLSPSISNTMHMSASVTKGIHKVGYEKEIREKDTRLNQRKKTRSNASKNETARDLKQCEQTSR